MSDATQLPSVSTHCSTSNCCVPACGFSFASALCTAWISLWCGRTLLLCTCLLQRWLVGRHSKENPNFTCAGAWDCHQPSDHWSWSTLLFQSYRFASSFPHKAPWFRWIAISVAYVTLLACSLSSWHLKAFYRRIWTLLQLQSTFARDHQCRLSGCLSRPWAHRKYQRFDRVFSSFPWFHMRL